MVETIEEYCTHLEQKHKIGILRLKREREKVF
mgnify:CR=1 FL=1